MGSPDLQNTGEIPMPLKIFVQSLSRRVFTAFVPLLSELLIKQMYWGIDSTHRCTGVQRCQAAAECLPHSQLFPHIVSPPVIEINLPLFLLVQNCCWVSEWYLKSNSEGEQEILKLILIFTYRKRNQNKPAKASSFHVFRRVRLWSFHREISHCGKFMGPTGTKTWARTHFYWATETTNHWFQTTCI